MSAYDTVQVLVIGCAVLASGGYALARFVPGLRAWVAGRCLRSRSGAVRAAGSRLMAGGSGCGGGCGSCGGCGSANDKPLITAKSVR